MDRTEAYKYFNGGRLQAKREYCRTYVTRLYEMLEDMLEKHIHEIFVPTKVVKNYCYSENETLEIVIGDINDKLGVETFAIGKKHWFKGWHITAK